MPPRTPGYSIHATWNSWLPYPCHPELLATLSMPPGTPGYPSFHPEHVIMWFLFLMVLVCDKEREVLSCV